MLDAARRLIEERGDANVTLEDVAREAGITRQTVYAHMSSRAGLLLALVEHIDDGNRLAARVANALEAPTGFEAIERYVAMVAEMTPQILGVATALSRLRAVDPDAAGAWDDRMAARMRTCSLLVERLADEGVLRPEWTVETGTDLLFAAVSIPMWEVLVGDRGWTPEQWSRRTARLVVGSLAR